MLKIDRVVPLEPQHLRDLDADRLRFDLDATPEDQIKLLTTIGPARAMLFEDRVVCCAGIIPQCPGNGKVWSFITVEPGIRQLLTLTRRAKEFLDEVQLDDEYERLEITVEDDYPQGHIWAKRLGFRKECVMKRYRLGVDHALYSRLANGKRD